MQFAMQHFAMQQQTWHKNSQVCEQEAQSSCTPLTIAKYTATQTYWCWGSEPAMDRSIEMRQDSGQEASNYWS